VLVVENETTGPNNTSTIITNKTFNFSTYRQVKITINDAEKFHYDVYIRRTLFCWQSNILK
jgi:hypothetical protein